MRDKILKNYTTTALIDELKIRANAPLPASAKVITPYQIMREMISQGWKEDAMRGRSDSRIDKIWAYLGYPNFNDDISWCAATVNCCLKLAGYKTSESIPLARSFETYGMYTDEMVEGDIVVFKKNNSQWQGHVGFVKNVNTVTNSILVAGGNQENKICYHSYPIKGDTLSFSAARKIGNSDYPIDYKTLKEWKLI